MATKRRRGPKAPKAVKRIRARAGRALGHAAKLAERAIAAFFRHRCPQLAASISYYALFSIFPAAILMAAIFGLVIDDENARAEVVDFLFEELPVSDEEGRRDLESVVEGVTRNTGTLGIIGLAVFLYSASALMGAVRNSLSIVFETEQRRPPLRGKALDILLVLALGLLIAVSLLVTVLRELAVDLGRELGFPGRALEAALDASGILIPLGLSLIVFAVVFVVVPRPPHGLRDVWPGAVLAAVGYELAKRGFALYLEHFADYSAVYGSIGAVITFLVFIYIAAMVFLLGGQFAALWPRVRAGEFDDGEGKPLREEVLGFLRGLVIDQRKETQDARSERESDPRSRDSV